MLVNEKQPFQTGDIFELSNIALHGEIFSLNEQKRLAKVIFKSKRTRLMIGIILSQETFDELPNDIERIRFLDKVYYTGSQLLTSGDWQIIGRQRVSEIEQCLTLRVVGSALYVLDENLGVVPKTDLKKYPKQLISGLGALYYHINQDLAIGT